MERLKEILRLDEDPLGGARPLDRSLVEEIDETIREAVEGDMSPALLQFVNPLIQSQKKEGGDALFYTAARIQSTVGDPGIANQLYFLLSERLEQHGEWSGLIAVLDRVLKPGCAAEFARLTARVWEKGGGKHATVELLRRAHEISPDDYRILWALGSSLLAAGDGDGRGLITRSLSDLAKKKDFDRLEEGVLILVDDPSKDELEALLSTVDQLLKGDEIDRAVTVFDFSKSAMIENGLSGEAWQLLRKRIEKEPDDCPLRPIAAEFGPGNYSGVLNVKKLFERAGVAKASVPIADALGELDKLLELPPGSYVVHSGWGVGQITDNDGESLFIHFSDRQDHKMSHKLAKSALIQLEATDLRVKLFTDREGVMRAVHENRADLLHYVLEHLGGVAKRDDIRKQLLHLELLTPQTWAEWWRNAKKQSEKDPRFDLSQSFRNVVRLVKEGEEHAILPEVSLSGNLKKGLGVLFSFLEQHPDDAESVAKRYGENILGRATDEDISPPLRVMAHVLAHQIGCGDADGLESALVDLAREPDLGPLSTEHQKSLLAIAPEHLKTLLVPLLLTSRVMTVRREAWTAMHELPEDERERIIEGALERSPRDAYAVLHVVREMLSERPADAVHLIHALLYVIEEPEREPHRKDGMAIIESPVFRDALTKCEPSEGDLEFLASRLAHWKHSERYLFPILEAMEKTRFDWVAETVEEKRRGLRPQAEASVMERFGGRVLMTRPTLLRLRKEAEEIDWDLKTTIPQMIRKAREHGDLRENAEYDAAKQKQREATKRLEQLYDRIRLAQAIEELEMDDDIVLPGAEVSLKASTGEDVTYWVLGEGDRDLGDEVVSYRAPLGTMLLGKKVGDEVGPMNDKTFTITGLRRKLPASTD